MGKSFSVSSFNVLYKQGLFLMLFFISGCTYNKATEVKPTISVSYKEDIQPIIASSCYNCHTATATNPDKAGYAFLDDFNELKRYALKPSITNSSFTTLQARIRFIEYPGMPFKESPLPESDILKIEAWIQAGAPNN